MRNSGKWSDMAAVNFLGNISWEIKLEKLLPMGAFQWEVILVGWTLWGKNILDGRKSRNLFVALCCSYFNKLTLTSSRRKTVFCSSANSADSGLW